MLLTWTVNLVAAVTTQAFLMDETFWIIPKYFIVLTDGLPSA